MAVSSNSTTAADDLDILDSSRPIEDDQTVVRRLQRFFQSAVYHRVWQAWRTNASIDYRFREGDHYSDAELKELKERGQPPSIRNEIKPIVDRVHGQFIQTRQTVTYLGRNTPADDDTSHVLQDLGRFVDQSNDYEFHESEVTLDGLTGGFGVLEIGTRKNELGQDEIFEQSENPFDYYPDPFSLRWDWSDAKFVSRAKWMDLEDAIALWPDKSEPLKQCVYGHAYQLEADTGIDPKVQNEPMALYVDKDRKRMRPVECWYRRKMRQYQIYGPDGVTTIGIPVDATRKGKLLKMAPGTFDKEVIVDRMWVGVYCAGLLIHHDQSPYRHNYFPFVPFFADRKKNGEPFGLVRPLVPIQEALNKRESKALNMLSNRRIIMEENAIKNPEEARIENGLADGIVEVAPGALSGQRVSFPDNVDIGNGQVVMLQEAKAAMPRVSGINDESMGLRSEVRSGVGIQRKQMMTGLITNPVTTAMRRFRRLKAKVVLALIPQVFTEAMTFQVTDDPNAARLVTVTSDHLTAIKTRIYDVIIADTPDYLTLRDEQLDKLFTLWPQIAQLGPGMMKVALSMTDLRDKDGLMKMLDQAMQAPPQQPKMNLSLTWADLSDEEKAYFAMTALQSPELAQYLAQRGGDPAFMAKIKASLAQTQIKEGTKAQMERGKMDIAAMQTAMEGRLKARELTQSAAERAASEQGAAV